RARVSFDDPESPRPAFSVHAIHGELRRHVLLELAVLLFRRADALVPERALELVHPATQLQEEPPVCPAQVVEAAPGAVEAGAPEYILECVFSHLAMHRAA